MSNSTNINEKTLRERANSYDRRKTLMPKQNDEKKAIGQCHRTNI